MENKQKRFTEQELGTIRALFKDNEAGLKVLRKVFLPQYEYDAPLGQVIDLWMTLNFQNMSPEEKIVNLTARNQVITHVEQQLSQLQFLANEKEETAEEKANRLAKNSSK